MTRNWTCASCEREARECEEAFEWTDRIVCGECYKRLSAASMASPQQTERSSTFLNDVLSTLTPEAVCIATNKPSGWEHRLWGQILVDEVERSKPLLISPPAAGRVTVAPGGTPSWIASRIEAFKRINADIERLFNSNHDDAFGLPGEDGNVLGIVRFARQLSAHYRQTIEWMHSLRSADLDPRFRPLAYEVSNLAYSILRPFEAFGPNLLRQIEAALVAPPGTHTEVDALLHVSPDWSRVFAAMEAVQKSLRVRASIRP